MVSKLLSCWELVYMNSYMSLKVPSQGVWVHLLLCRPSPQLISLQSNPLHALTFGWFSLFSTTELSSRNWVRSYLIFFPPWNWDNNSHRHSFQEPCYTSVLKYWFLSAGNAINLRSRIVFHWFAASPSLPMLIAKRQLVGDSSLSVYM